MSVIEEINKNYDTCNLSNDYSASVCVLIPTSKRPMKLEISKEYFETCLDFEKAINYNLEESIKKYKGD